MTLSDLSSIVGMISGLAVLGSLVYLAQQTRQNAKHTRALIQQGRTEQIIATTTAFAEDASLAALRLRGDRGDTTLDAVQLFQYSMIRLALFFNWEDQFYQHAAGLLDGPRFAAMMKRIEAHFQSPGARLAYKQNRMAFAPDFQSFMDSMMHRIHVVAKPTDVVAVWKAGIEAELSQANP